MNLFFQIQSIQLLIFSMDDQEEVVNLDYALVGLFFYFSLEVMVYLIHNLKYQI